MNESSTLILIHGLGGIGKSTLAKEFIQCNRDGFQHLIWVEQYSDLQSDLALNPVIEKNLNFSFQKEDKAEARFELIVNALQQLEGKNLMVIDDFIGSSVANKSLDKLANLTADWKILVTSRQQLDNYKLYKLDILNETDAKHLFSEYYHGQLTEEELRELFELIGYHTLTIELMAKTLEKSLTLNSINQLTNYLREKKLDHEQLAKKIVTPHAGPEEVTMYTHLISAFSLTELGNLEKWLLKQFTVLPSEQMTFQFISEILQIDENSRERIADSLQELAQKGWLQNPEKGIFQIHQIIQIITEYQEKITFEDCETLIDFFINKLNIERYSNPSHAFKWTVYGEAINKYFSHSKAPKIFVIQNQIAGIYRELGHYKKAQLLLEKALNINIELFGVDAPFVLFLKSNLGSVYFLLGKFSDAKILLQEALLETQKSLSELSASALPLEKKSALAEQIKSFEASNKSKLGLVYRELGQFEEAKDKLEEAVEAHKRAFGEDHPRYAAILSNLAMVYKMIESFDSLKKAKELLEKVLIIEENYYGKDHYTIATTHSNLGLVLKGLKEYDEAEKYLEIALKTNTKYFGEKSPRTVNSQSNLAMLYRKMKKLDKAKELLEKALITTKNTDGMINSSTLELQAKIAAVYFDKEDYEKSLELMSEVCLYAPEVYGIHNPKTMKVNDELQVIKKRWDESKRK